MAPVMALATERSKSLEALILLGLKAFKYVPRILLKKGIVFVTVVRFWESGTWEDRRRASHNAPE